MYRKLLRELKQYRKSALLSPLYAALEAIVDILIPFVIASLIDEGVSSGSMPVILKYGAVMLVLAVLGLLFGILAGRHAAYASTGFAANVRAAIFRNIQTFSFSNIDKFSTAGLITRLTTDVTNLQNSFQMMIRMCIRAPFMLVCAFIMSMLISPRLSTIFLIATLLLLFFLGLIIFLAMGRFRKAIEKYDELNASIQENVSAIRVVKAYVREDYENQKFEKAAGNIYQMFVRAERVVANNAPVMTMAIYSCILILSWMAAKMIVVGDLTTGQLTSLLTYVMNILISLMMLSMVFVMLALSTASAQRIAEVLDESSDLTNPPHADMVVPDGSVDFKDVSFAYQHFRKNAENGTVSKGRMGKPVLQHVSFHVDAGETIGILGGTGSAKSSLVNLISRLYDPVEGSVLVGGKDVRTYDLDILRSHVAVVLQKNTLFSGTILENLRWGCADATREECEHACHLACADEFIERFPDKYDTYIEQGGTNVSGGQKQRLCIARALLRKPKILILDDSTSAVDTTTDAKIRKAFREELPGTTKFIIAQRISSLQDADRIMVLDDGRISGLDTHENLLKYNEIYREVFESQAKSAGDFDVKGGEA